MKDWSLGATVHWQDLRFWQPFNKSIPKPPPQSRTFATYAEADAFRKTLPRGNPDGEVISNIAPVKPPEVKRAGKQGDAVGELWLGGRMRSSGRKLTA